MVRTADHKLVVDPAHDTGELYDLAADPGEHNNLWNEPSAACIKAEMLVRLAHAMARTADPMPERVAPW